MTQTTYMDKLHDEIILIKYHLNEFEKKYNSIRKHEIEIQSHKRAKTEFYSKQRQKGVLTALQKLQIKNRTNNLPENSLDYTKITFGKLKGQPYSVLENPSYRPYALYFLENTFTPKKLKKYIKTIYTFTREERVFAQKRKVWERVLIV